MNKRLLLLVFSFSLISCGTYNKPSEKEVMLQQEVQELREELAKEKTKEPVVIENPPIEDLTRAEIMERNAIHNEIQQMNKLEKERKEAEALKLKQEQEKKQQELKKEAEVITPVYNPPITSTGQIKIDTKSSPLTLRSGSSTNSKALDAIPKGAVIEYGQTKQIGKYTWYNVKYNGKEGWLRGDYISPQ